MNGVVTQILCVGAGGMIGSLMRYGLTILLRTFSLTFPFGTLGSNLLGCLIIGLVMQMAAHTDAISSEWRLFLATGICGGFTTLSSLVYEIAQFLRTGEWLHALVYLNVTIIGCMITFYLGAFIVKLLVKI